MTGDQELPIIVNRSGCWAMRHSALCSLNMQLLDNRVGPQWLKHLACQQ